MQKMFLSAFWFIIFFCFVILLLKKRICWFKAVFTSEKKAYYSPSDMLHNSTSSLFKSDHSSVLFIKAGAICIQVRSRLVYHGRYNIYSLNKRTQLPYNKIGTFKTFKMSCKKVLKAIQNKWMNTFICIIKMNPSHFIPIIQQ